MAERSREIQTFRIELGEKTEFSDVKKNRINQAIKSIVIGRASSPNVVIRAKTKDGDEFFLYPGRVINFKNPIQGIVFSWPAYTGEWADVDISDGEHLVSFTPPQGVSLVSNVASKKVSKFVELYYPLGGGTPIQDKIVDANPNRIKLEIELFSTMRVFLGSVEDTTPGVGNSIRREKCDTIMPFCKKVFHTNGELWGIGDSDFKSTYEAGTNPNGISLKVTEYLK